MTATPHEHEQRLLEHPLKLAPRLVERLWGGDFLREFHGFTPGTSAGAAAGSEGQGAAHTAPSGPVGESWVMGEDNVVSSGPLKGRRLADLAKAHGAALLGTANVERYGTKLALLAKFLAAEQILSVQVHPGDAYALEHESHTGHLGKAEAWYVLDAEPDAYVLWGFARDVTPDEVREAVRSGEFEALLNRLPVSRGDVIVNPAGIVHAVGAGVTLFEIQQSSDLTYRLYDFDRRGADGRPRELHVDKALDVAYLGRSDPAAMSGRAPAANAPTNAWRRLVELPEFVLDAAELSGAHGARLLADTTSAESLELLVLTRGQATVCAAPRSAVNGPSGQRSQPREPWGCVELRRGDAVLLPAALGPYTVSGEGELLRCAVAKPSVG